MTPYTLIHDWLGGAVSRYDILCDIDVSGEWFEGLELPDEVEQILSTLGVHFEPDKGESITIEKVEDNPTEFRFLT